MDDSHGTATGKEGISTVAMKAKKTQVDHKLEPIIFTKTVEDRLVKQTDKTYNALMC